MVETLMTAVSKRSLLRNVVVRVVLVESVTSVMIGFLFARHCNEIVQSKRQGRTSPSSQLLRSWCSSVLSCCCLHPGHFGPQATDLPTRW
jgi:nitrogen fixation/metabolism regulation signal transduction histidine kinase